MPKKPTKTTRKAAQKKVKARRKTSGNRVARLRNQTGIRSLENSLKARNEEDVNQAAFRVVREATKD